MRIDSEAMADCLASGPKSFCLSAGLEFDARGPAFRNDHAISLCVKSLGGSFEVLGKELVAKRRVAAIVGFSEQSLCMLYYDYNKKAEVFLNDGSICAPADYYYLDWIVARRVAMLWSSGGMAWPYSSLPDTMYNESLLSMRSAKNKKVLREFFVSVGVSQSQLEERQNLLEYSSPGSPDFQGSSANWQDAAVAFYRRFGFRGPKRRLDVSLALCGLNPDLENFYWRPGS